MPSRKKRVLRSIAGCHTHDIAENKPDYALKQASVQLAEEKRFQNNMGALALFHWKGDND